MSETFYYARVSSTDQNLDRQLDAFRALGADDRHIITDKASGKDTNRPGYNALRSTILRPGDTLVIKSLDRLSRCKADIAQELAYYRANNIRLKVIDLPTTMIDAGDNSLILDMVTNILIEVLSTLAEQERANIKARQAEGIAAAKARGKHLGRPSAQLPADWDKLAAQWRNREITTAQLAQLSGLSPATCYRLAGRRNPA